MISYSGSLPTQCSISFSRTKTHHDVQQRTSRPLDRHRRSFLRGTRPRVLLRPDRSGPGIPAEDLLPARAPGDRGAVRVRDRGADGDRASAYARCTLGPALVCDDPHEPDLWRGRPDHRLDLGTGVVGALVGVGRADARVVLDRLSAVRHLSAVALRDRGPRAPGAVCLGVRDHRGGVRAAELHRGQAVRLLRPPARARSHLEPPAPRWPSRSWCRSWRWACCSRRFAGTSSRPSARACCSKHDRGSSASNDASSSRAPCRKTRTTGTWRPPTSCSSPSS